MAHMGEIDANYMHGWNPGVHEMAKAMGLGRYANGGAGRVNGANAQTVRSAMGAPASDPTADAFMRILGGAPDGRTPGNGGQFSSSYQNELRKLAHMLQQQGRGGDTLLAHINPREAKMLHQTTDGGSVNPQTGLLEFTDVGQGDGGGDPGGFGGGGGGSFGGGSDSPGPDIGGWGGPDTVGQNPNSSLDNTPSGGGSYDVGFAPGFGRPDVPADPRGPDTRGSSLDPSYPGGSQGSYPGEPGTVGRDGTRGPNTSGYGFKPGVGSTLLNTFVDLVGPGAGLTRRGIQLTGITPDPVGPRGLAPGSDDDREGGGGVNQAADGGSGSPFVKPTNTLARPAKMNAPEFLDFESDDPLQRRAKIATYATQGTGGKWADEQTFDYWKNLVQRDLISDAGAMPDFANLLGTELQYLGSRGIQAPNSTRALLEAILSA